MGKTTSLPKTPSTSKKAASTVSKKSRSTKDSTESATKSAKKIKVIKKQTVELAKEVATPAQLDQIRTAIRTQKNYSGKSHTPGTHETLLGMTNGMSEGQLTKFIAADRRENPSLFSWIAEKPTPEETEVMVDEIIEAGRLESNYEARQKAVEAAGKKDTFKRDVRDALVVKFGASDDTVRKVLRADRLKNPNLHLFFVTPPVKPRSKVTADEKMAYEDSVIHARNEGRPVVTAFTIADVKLRLAELDSPPVDKRDSAHKTQLYRTLMRLAKMAGENSTGDEGEGEGEGVGEGEGEGEGGADEADVDDE